MSAVALAGFLVGLCVVKSVVRPVEVFLFLLEEGPGSDLVGCCQLGRCGAGAEGPSVFLKCFEVCVEFVFLSCISCLMLCRCPRFEMWFFLEVEALCSLCTVMGV